MEPSYLENVSSPSMFVYNYPPASSEKSHVQWSREEDKIFENSIAVFGIESQFLLPSLAMRLPTKSVSEIEQHLKTLLEDIQMIEAGLIELPNYAITNDESRPGQVDSERHKKGKTKATSGDRRKAIPWTKTEHESFIQGLQQYGKGDWKSISRNCVFSKTPIQVASHAQKYFLKLNNPNARQRNMRTAEDPPVEEDEYSP